MKKSKIKKEIKKFDLEKFEVAKLKNLRAINGGDATGDITVTETVYKDAQTF